MFSRSACNVSFVVALFFAFGLAAADGYSLSGETWPVGSTITMHLGLTHDPQPLLQDGSATWNDSAADALSIWNQYLVTIALAPAGPITPADSDGQNTASFAYDVYGQSFGTNVLAVTVRHWTGATLNETDVLFFAGWKWDSYRGPLQGSGPTTLIDFHRVALHEFGHVLGLNHPDDAGQTVVAQMNSVISDLDHLADDDIAGAQAMYGPKITSLQGTQGAASGNNFSYQITANNNPTSFAASGLPPELHLNSATGLISGRCYTLGTFQVSIEADSARGAAIGKFTLDVEGQIITSSVSPPAILIGDSFSYQITAGNQPTSFTAVGLPAGLSLDPNTGIISGTPTVTGNFSVGITAIGATAIAAGPLLIRILPPEITSSLAQQNLELGATFRYQITSTHNPTSFSATGLPPGFSFDPASGIITGTASTPGYYTIGLQAHTAFGDAVASLSLDIVGPHLVSTNLSGQVGQPYDFTIGATGNPTSFEISGSLPPGLQINLTTSEITGTPTVSGSYTVNITAHTPYGDAHGVVYFFIQGASNYTPPLATIPIDGTGQIIADSVRPRVYVAMINGLTVIDTNSNTIVQHFGGYMVGGMAISLDNKTLYFTLPDSHQIFTLDLDTLKSLSVPMTTHAPNAIAVGADGILYITDKYVNGYIYGIDPSSGAQVSSFTPEAAPPYYQLAMKGTADGKTLLAVEQIHSAPVATKYAINAGAAPQVVQQVTVANDAVSGISISQDGTRAIFILSTAYSTNPLQPTPIRSIADLNTVVANVATSYKPSDMVFSPDGNFVVARSGIRVDTIRISNSAVVQTALLPSTAPFASAVPTLAVDVNGHLFVLGVGSPGGSFGTVFAYPMQGPAVPAKSLANVSTRVRTETGDDVAIGGFIIEGTAPKTVIIRGIGPSLTNSGLSGVLADPTIELHAEDGSVITSNDNWNEHRQDVLNTNKWPSDDHESAIVATLNPGHYTAILRGLNNGVGIGLIEVFDVDPTSASRITNISTRGHVETGDNVMIGGFIIGGDQPTKVIVRALGPSMAKLQVYPTYWPIQRSIFTTRTGTDSPRMTIGRATRQPRSSIAV